MPLPHRARPSLRGGQLVLALGALALAAAAAAAPGPGVAYVSNQSGDVSVIDLATLEPTGTVDPGGKEPRGIGVTADGKLLVVANREGGAVAVIDRASGKLLRHIPIGQNPEFVRTRGHLAFVSYEPGSAGKPPAAAGSAPASAAEAPAASGPEAGGEKGKGGKGGDDDEPATPAHVAVVDLDKGKVLLSIRGGRETEGIEFTPDGRNVIVANEADNNLTMHSIATGKVVRTVDLKSYGLRPRGIKRAPDGRHYVATLEFSNLAAVLDANLKVVDTIKTAEAPYGLAFDRSGAKLYVAAARGKVLQVFDARTWAPEKDIPIGNRCWHFSFTPDDRNILVACGRSNEIIVIDAKTQEAVKHIPDAQLPWGIVTYPKAPGSLDAVE